MLHLDHGATSVCASETPLNSCGESDGVVPRFMHDGNVVAKSSGIMHYLDDVFPSPPLMPRDTLDRSRVHLFKKLRDEYIHPACIVYRFATTNRAPLASLSQPERHARQNAAAAYMVRLEMLKLARLWDHKPGVARWWERLKARPSYRTAIINWLRPQDYARYEKMNDPWRDVSNNLAPESRRHALIGTRVGGS